MGYIQEDAFPPVNHNKTIQARCDDSSLHVVHIWNHLDRASVHDFIEATRDRFRYDRDKKEDVEIEVYDGERLLYNDEQLSGWRTYRVRFRRNGAYIVL